MSEICESATIDNVVRAVTSAGKALRLYPPTSPIPRQCLESAEAALAAYFANGEPVVALAVARDGFAFQGAPLGTAVVGAQELSDELREHGVAELAFLPGCDANELLALMRAVLTPPGELRASGGLSVALVEAGVEHARVAGVQLTVVDQAAAGPSTDVEEFLRSLSADPERLGAWFASAAGGDPASFQEGLTELARVSGSAGLGPLLESLAVAFRTQDAERKDALLELAMDPGPVRELTGQMFQNLSSADIAGSILGGTFGKNMLSLSSALTNLPLDQVTAQVRAEVRAMLPASGHSAKEADFLEHMLDVRGRATPEPALVDTDAVYRAVADATRLSAKSVAASRAAVDAAQRDVASSTVRTMLHLLDQQQDFELYCAAAMNLSSMVPRLIEQGDLDMAARVMTEFGNREAYNDSPWPQLSGRLREARNAAAGPRAMRALLAAVQADHAAVESARSIVRSAGDAGTSALVTEAIALKAPGLQVAEAIIGRRIVDALNECASAAQWYQVAPLVTRLAQEGDAHSVSTIESLLKRPDEQSRREVVTGLAMAGTPAATRLIGHALRDPSAEVEISAVRALVRHCPPSADKLLAARLAELDIDNGDFAIARELIAALAKVPGAAADEALERLAGRRALIKRGHFAEVQELVKRAQATRMRGGDT